MRTRGMDIISSLPRNIIELILSQLPIRDAVRTSILSTKWRYAWTSIPVLTFNDECHPPSEEKATSSRISCIVDNILLVHCCPILRFEVSHYLYDCKSHIDKWVLHLVKKGTNELSLKFWDDEEDVFKVPSCLFSCEQLRLLKLRRCMLKLPRDFRGLSCLNELELHEAYFSEKTIHHLVSSCPLLEHLSLRYNHHLNYINFHAPKLKHLSVTGAFDDLSLVGCSLLANLDISLLSIGEIKKKDERLDICILDKALGCLTSLKMLAVEEYFIDFLVKGTLLDRLPNAFGHLMHVSLTMNFQNFKEISTVLCLFRSSPKLQSIQIWSTSRVEEATFYDVGLWDGTSDCVFHQLKTIKVKNLKGEEHEVEFLKFVLANAPVLEAMSVKANKKTKLEKAFSIVKTLLLLRRASALAKIVYMD